MVPPFGPFLTEPEAGNHFKLLGQLCFDPASNEALLLIDITFMNEVKLPIGGWLLSDSSVA